MPQGACCARKRPAKDGPGEKRFYDRVFQTLEDACEQFFKVGLQLLVATPAAMYFEFDGNLLQTILNACVITPSQPASVF